jgi:hypothetical protein
MRLPGFKEPLALPFLVSGAITCAFGLPIPSNFTSNVVGLLYD